MTHQPNNPGGTGFPLHPYPSHQTMPHQQQPRQAYSAHPANQSFQGTPAVGFPAQGFNQSQPMMQFPPQMLRNAPIQQQQQFQRMPIRQATLVLCPVHMSPPLVYTARPPTFQQGAPQHGVRPSMVQAAGFQQTMPQAIGAPSLAQPQGNMMAQHAIPQANYTSVVGGPGQTPPSSSAMPPVPYNPPNAMNTMPTESHIEPQNQPAPAPAAAAPVPAVAHSTQGSRSKPVLKHPTTGEHIDLTTGPSRPTGGAGRGTPRPAHQSTQSPAGQPSVARTSSLSYSAAEFKPGFPPGRSVSSQPPVVQSAPANQTSFAAPLVAKSSSDSVSSTRATKLNSSAKVFTPPDTMSDNQSDTGADSENTTSSETSEPNVAESATPSSVSSASSTVPESGPKAEVTSAAETAAAPLPAAAPAHPSPSKSPSKVRSRSQSPVTSGASTQESLTFEDRQEQPKSSSPKAAKASDASGVGSAATSDKSQSEDTSSVTNGTADSEDSTASSTAPPARSMSKSNIHYSDPDQWTPDNVSGSKAYSRDFLLQFQAVQVQKPPNLPIIEGVTTESRRSGRDGRGSVGGPPPGGNSFGNNFMPAFLQGSGGGGGGPMGGRGGSGGMVGGIGGGSRGGSGGGSDMRRGSRQKSGGGGHSGGHGGGPRVIQLPAAVEPLKNSENRWTLTKDRKVDVDAEEIVTEKLGRSFRGYLNKLTPEKFDKIAENIKKLQIDNESRLDLVIDIVFEKALSEPKFCPSYAMICRYMLTIKVPVNNGEPNERNEVPNVSFRKKLLTRCQSLFEQDKKDDLRNQADLEKMKAKVAADPENKVLIQGKLDVEAEIGKAKRRTLGNIKFIGELFKLKILTEPIMHECVVKLLRSVDEESLEALCKLLTTVGKDLDHEKAQKRMLEYFDRIDKIVRTGKMPNRIKFMLQALVELRQNNWIARRDEAKPATINEIHQQAKDEEISKRLESQQAQLASRSQRQDRPGIRGRGSGGQSADGWSTTPVRQSRVSVDSDKLKSASQRLQQQSRGDGDIQLGPGGKGFGWGRGSSGGATAAATATRDDRQTTNRYATLASAPEPRQARSTGRPEPRSGSGAGPRRTSSGRDQMQQQQPVGRASSQKAKEREEALSLVRLSSSGTSNEGKSATPAVASSETNALSEQKATEKALATLREYLSIHDVKEVKECLLELKSPGHFAAITKSWFEHVIERKPKEQFETGDLIAQLLKSGSKGLFTRDNIAAGIHSLLADAEDMSIDIPLYWRYLAGILAPVAAQCPAVLVPVSTSSYLLDMCKVATLMSEVVMALRNGDGMKFSDDMVAEFWSESGLSWSSILMDHEPLEAEFLKSKKLEFLLSSGKAVNTDKELKQMLKKRMPNDQVNDWIKDNVDKEALKEKPFIHALVTAVVEACVVPGVSKGQQSSVAPSFSLDKAALVDRRTLLVKYLNSDVHRQLFAILAAEAVVSKLEHPQGLLHELLNTLYDDQLCDALEEETLFKWRDLSGEQAPQGHGVAVQSVQQFLNFLSSADTA